MAGSWCDINAGTASWRGITIIRFYHYSIKTILGLLIVLYSSLVYSNEYIDASSKKLQNVSSRVGLFTNRSTNIYDPFMAKLPTFFKINHKKEIILPRTEFETWARINLVNKSRVPISRVLFLTQAKVGKIDFFANNQIFKSGNERPIRRRAFNTRLPSIIVEIAPFETEIIYFKQHGVDPVNTKVMISDELNFQYYANKFENTYRIYSGAIFALILYNLILVLFLKEEKYFLYCSLSMSFFVLILNHFGILDYIDIFEETTFSSFDASIYTFTTLMAYFFTYSFLNIPKYAKDFVRFYNIGIKIGFCIFLLTFIPIFIEFDSMYIRVFARKLADYYVYLSLILGFWLASVSLFRGAPLGKLFFVTLFIIFIRVSIMYGCYFGVLPNTYFTTMLILFMNTLEMLTLSLALGYKIIVIDKTMREASIKIKGKEKYQQLLRIISHDVVNSLQVIIMSNRRLKKTTSDTAAHKSCSKIERATNNITEILEQIKIEEKLASDSINIILNEVDLKEVINDCLFIFEDRLVEKNLLIKVAIDDDATAVLAEKFTLKNNVLGNIISNAIKFSEEGGEIHIRSERISPEKVRLLIQDNGKGFSTEVLSYLADRTSIMVSEKGTKGETGTGFGLRIIKSYIKTYKGELNTYNKGGAVFEIILNRG